MLLAWSLWGSPLGIPSAQANETFARDDPVIEKASTGITAEERASSCSAQEVESYRVQFPILKDIDLWAMGLTECPNCQSIGLVAFS